MPSRRAHPMRRGTARRRTTWARSLGTITNAAVGGYGTVDLLAEFKAAGGVQQGVTVGRILLRWAHTTLVATGDEFAIGVIRGQNTDVGTSIAGAPEPVADPYEDWLYWSVHYACSMAGAGAQFYGGGSNVGYVDIRAKRKLEDLQMSLNLVTRNAVSGTFPATILYSSSVLLLLP